jgi:ribosomal protein S27AE
LKCADSEPRLEFGKALDFTVFLVQFCGLVRVTHSVGSIDAKEGVQEPQRMYSENDLTQRGKVCPKCSYQRTATDRGPDWSCPKCGVVYEKLQSRDSGHRRTPRARTQTPTEKSFPVGAALVLGLALAGGAFWWFGKSRNQLSPADAASNAQKHSQIAQAAEQLANDQAQAKLEDDWVNMRQPQAWDKLLAQAQAGHVRSMAAVGASYAQGRVNGKVDHAMAQVWLEKAANQGELDAMVALAYLLEKPASGGPQYSLVANWYKRAAREGHATALVGLGRLHAGSVRDVTQNKPAGYTLFLLARRIWQSTELKTNWTQPGELGWLGAGSFMSQVKPDLSLVEIAAAEEAAAAWKPGQPLPAGI